MPDSSRNSNSENAEEEPPLEGYERYVFGKDSLCGDVIFVTVESTCRTL